MRDIKEFYETWNVEELPQYIKILIKFADELIFEEISSMLSDFEVKDPLVLDCGCGFGTFYRLTETFNTIYLDISLNMLKKFTKTERKICGNILHLPFKDKTFDLILCINVLEHVDKSKALKEINRVLKDNGRVIVVVVNKKCLFKEEVFNDFKIFHETMGIDDFKVEFKILKYTSTYFLPPIVKILPRSVLSRVLKPWKWIDKRLSKIFKGRGQFLIIELEKSR
ncbi:Methyltransferase type 11 [Methanocaldococcus vulcanius M7]|uniref:Methyltransferase type 11 n=1 Tax=Methanocaldococcus vulcanius (strain ATCC 700851 / DSM 12094 / M7) TaxID=579137 RepID=C9RHW1_METVM|nr:class I SAM-dependent methyltransferase [Methanocaldococcus vulcanius]ACX73163.1 Methyltransferase type 11 [Methanocaldococcus vulcanius M7]